MKKHIHHILPRYRCKELGINPDFPENLIELSVEEHAEAHRILWEGGGRHEDLVAWKSLSEQIGKEEIFLETSRVGGLNNRGKKKSKEHRQKIAKANKLVVKGPLSNETKQKISKSMKGNKNSQSHSSDEYKKTQSKAMKKAWAKRKEKKA